MTEQILTNSVLAAADGTLKRVLCISSGQAALFALSQEDGSACSKSLDIEVRPLAELQRDLESGALRPAADPYLSFRSQAMSASAQSAAQQRFDLIKPLAECPHAALDCALRRALLREIYAAHPEQNQSALRMKVQRTLWTYYQKGQTLSALCPNYGKNRGRQRSFTDKKPGRHSQTGSGIPLDQEAKKLMHRICKEYLLTDKKLTLSQAHTALVAAYKEQHSDCAPGQWPSEAQLRWFYKHNYSVTERNAKRAGRINYQKNNRPLHGSAVDVAPNVGDVYLIDATQSDIYICTEQDKKPLGRAWFYLTADVASGMIASIFASLEAPQYIMACKALYMAVAPKAQFLQRWGIPQDRYKWDISGIPAAVWADNAELHSDRLQDFLRAFNIVNSFHPAYRADCKGLVESLFHSIHKEILPHTDSIPDNISQHKAGHQEKRHLAVLSLPELQKMLILAAQVVNRRVREIAPPDFSPELPNTPVAFKAWAERTDRCRLRQFSNLEYVRIMLLPHEKPSVSEHGFTVNGITWNCEEARAAGYFERGAERLDPAALTAAYDPDDVSEAWLFPDIEHQPAYYWKCSLAPRSSFLKGMTVKEAQEALASRRTADAKAVIEHQAIAAQAWDDMNKIRQDAENAAAQARQNQPAQSRAAAVAGIAENRAQEIDVQAHQRYAIFTGQQPQKPTPSADSVKEKRYSDHRILPYSIEDMAD